MLSVALATLRTRWVGFVGAFLALALGTAMVAMTALALAATIATPFPGPQRFAAAPTVVVPADPTPMGWAAQPPAAIPPATVTRLEAAGRAVADRTFPVTRAGGPGNTVGHGWSAAAFTPYRLTAGHEPATDREVVLGGGSPAQVGSRITLTTADGPTDYTVAGTTPGSWFENAVFFTDAEAARLSPPVNALVSQADPDALRQAAGDGMLVLTGDDRKKADPDPSGGSDLLRDARAMAGTTLGVAIGVAAFIVSATFAFMADQRRRELALLRLVGATPRQVRRTLLAESAVIGLAAALAGCVLGAVGAGWLDHWMLDHDIAPSWFGIGVTAWPLLLSFVVGVLSAVGGAAAVAVKAGRVPPVEALRDAAADTRTMTPVRWVLGLGMLVGAISAAVYISADSPDYAINIRKYATVPLLFVGAFALLSPLLLPPVARLVTGPLERFGAGALIVRQNILTAGRRTAATVSPVVVAVGLVAAMAGVQDTGDRTTTDQARSEIHADAVVLPAAGGGRLDHHSLAALAAVPGVSAVPVTPTRLYLGGPDGSVFDGVNSLAVDPAALGRVLTPKVVDGSLDHLGDDFLVIDEKTAADDDLSPGSKVPVWLADDSRTDLTVAAVVQAGLGTDNSYVSAAHAVGGLPDRAWLTFPAGTDPAAGVAKVAAALPHGAVRAATTAGYFDALGSAQRQQNRTSTELVLGVAVGYALISVANTLAMAAAGRRRELAAFNLAGATRAQALRVVTGEALVAALIGTVLAVAAGIASLLSQGLSLVVLAGTVSPSIPWSPIALAAAVSAAVAALAAAVSVARTFRGRAVELAGLRE